MRQQASSTIQKISYQFLNTHFLVDYLFILVNKIQMSKNSFYTYDYFQPEEYRFSLDSVFLAQKVASLIKHHEDIQSWKVLDLCAGCGIIGLELALHLNISLNIDFLEIQEVYLPYFKKNLEMIFPKSHPQSMRFLLKNYQELMTSEYENNYDLIVSNPPYFFKNEGLLSPNEFKNRCRFFIDSDFETLIESTIKALKPGASAFMLLRSGIHHNRDVVSDIKSILGSRADTQKIDQVRGTDIVEISKKRN